MRQPTAGESSRAPGRQFALLVVAGALPLALHPLRSLHFDEAFAAHVVALPWDALLNFLARHDAHPPLFYGLLKLWTGLLGDSPVALRAFSAACGALAVAATMRLGRLALGAHGGVTAGAILAVSPLYLYTAAEARMYPLLMAFFALAAAEVLRLRDHRPGFPWLLALALAGFLYTHYLGMLLVAALGVAALWSGGRAAIRPFALALAAAALIFAPWVPVLLAHVLEGRMTPPWRGPLPADAPLQALHLIGFGGRTFGTAGYYFFPSAALGTQLLLAAPVVALLALGGAALLRTNATFARLATVAVGIPALGLFAVSVWTGSFIAYPRYFSFVMPFVAVGLAALIIRVGTSGRLFRAVAAGLLSVAVVLSVGSISDFSRDPTRGAGDWQGAARFLESRTRPPDVVAVYPAYARVPLGYYLPGLGDRQIPVDTDWRDSQAVAATRQMEELARQHDRIWVFVTWPLPPGGFVATHTKLSRTHRVTDFGDFGEVRVTLFTRR